MKAQSKYVALKPDRKHDFCPVLTDSHEGCVSSFSRTISMETCQ